MKNNQYWFKPKSFGYGIRPISWEGWLCTLALVGVILGIGYMNNIFVENALEKDMLIFIGETLIISFIVVHFTKEKTDGEIKWNWGRRNRIPSRLRSRDEKK